MVSAQARLWKPHHGSLLESEKEGEEKTCTKGNEAVGEAHPPLSFPVMLRCASSSDQISDVQFGAVGAPGIPISIHSSRASSFRLLHRLA